jgi:hypothetical protein
MTAVDGGSDPDAGRARDPSAFWTDPPWRGGKTPFRMGLAPIAEASWLPAKICKNEYQRKSMLLSTRREAVLAELAPHRPDIHAVADAVREQLLARGYPEQPESDPHPLARAALLVPDDLCVLVREAAGWHLVGACLCSPSYWRLAEKLGQPLPGIHAPVQGLEQHLGPAIARFLDNLPVGRCFARRNWNIHRTAERFHPEPEDWRSPPGPADCDGLYLRSERQTFRRFSPHTLLFTIDVGVHPLRDIRGYPSAAADLLAAIGAMSPVELASFGYRHHGAALETWLRAIPAQD